MVEKTYQQRNHQEVKPKYNKRAHTNGRKGNPRASKEIKETIPLNHIEILPKKLKHQELQKQKETPKNGEKKKKTCNQKNGRLTSKQLNEVEASKLSNIDFKRMVIGCSKKSQTTVRN